MMYGQKNIKLHLDYQGLWNNISQLAEEIMVEP